MYSFNITKIDIGGKPGNIKDMWHTKVNPSKLSLVKSNGGKIHQDEWKEIPWLVCDKTNLEVQKKNSLTNNTAMSNT